MSSRRSCNVGRRERGAVEVCYCLVLDILGFRASVVSADSVYQTKFVDEWINLVDASAAAEGIDRYQLISDSLFAVAAPTVEGLGHLLGLSRRLLNMGVDKRLLVRGAIAHGEVRWDRRIAHGAAIVDAYELGESWAWAGVSCTHAFGDLHAWWGVDGVVSYPVPRKRRAPQLRPAVVWDVPPDRKMISFAETPSAAPPVSNVPNDAVLLKLRNTTEFRDYLNRCRRQRLDPSKFHPVP